MKDVVAAAETRKETKRARGRPASSASVGPDLILRNARKTFGKRGFEATSVREIARDSGVDAALVAHHFGSKETLWLAVVEQIAEQMAPMIEATGALQRSRLGARARVESAVVRFIDEVFSDPDVGIFFSTAATEEGERLNVLIERLVRPYHDALVPLFADAARHGEMKIKDASVMFFMLLNAISKTVAYSHLMRAFSSLPEHEKKFKHTVLETALGMLA
ncbi:TetR family transcriptional regulator [Paraburkholderia phymatum]|uniref:Transcriptional regulator, TetR family n=1 Tax=Paraburkholderia phymatum (strain DSM 17167 / CIP 108236 / LMG 21445 / STM815) TaxID=391038 RepID=B2JV74_PARP8|nr:TetR family transcriptional regulator [Paraburkholderia phymatum]ACC74851.1 transcriptional regulator, TetR family [Paraburkholderia phymatum STM815]